MELVAVGSEETTCLLNQQETGGGEREREIQWEHKNRGREGEGRPSRGESKHEKERGMWGGWREEGQWLPVCRTSVPLRPVTLLHLHCSVMDRTRHSQEQPAKPRDQIIHREERFSLNTPALIYPHSPPLFSSPFLSLSHTHTHSPPPLLLPPKLRRNLKQWDPQNIPVKSQKPTHAPPPPQLRKWQYVTSGINRHSW